MNFRSDALTENLADDPILVDLQRANHELSDSTTKKRLVCNVASSIYIDEASYIDKAKRPRLQSVEPPSPKLLASPLKQQYLHEMADKTTDVNIYEELESSHDNKQTSASIKLQSELQQSDDFPFNAKDSPSKVDASDEEVPSKEVSMQEERGIDDKPPTTSMAAIDAEEIKEEIVSREHHSAEAASHPNKRYCHYIDRSY